MEGFKLSFFKNSVEILFSKQTSTQNKNKNKIKYAKSSVLQFLGILNPNLCTSPCIDPLPISIFPFYFYTPFIYPS